MSVKAKYTLVKTAADTNNNKFWRAELYDDDRVLVNWGRVGAAKGQSKWFNGGQQYIDKKIKEKKRKGYKEVRAIDNSNTHSATIDVSSAARSQIKTSCSITQGLVDYLVKTNIHQIITQSGGQLKVDLNAGQIELPSGLGVLTQDAIEDARDLLVKIDRGRNKRTKSFKQLVESYLMLVPQVVSRNRDWINEIFLNEKDVGAQRNLLDSLEATLGAIQGGQINEKVFDVELALVSDQNVLERIHKLFGGATGWQISKVYSVHIKNVEDFFLRKGKKIGNIMELWHGTRAANLLSILKSGLIIPRSASHGRNFGDGIYFSNQPQKALQYASRGYGYNEPTYMFVADVAMGKIYEVNRYSSRGLPKPGYDSTFAKVSSNELIVYDTSQVNLKYLVEFK